MHFRRGSSRRRAGSCYNAVLAAGMKEGRYSRNSSEDVASRANLRGQVGRRGWPAGGLAGEYTLRISAAAAGRSARWLSFRSLALSGRSRDLLRFANGESGRTDGDADCLTSPAGRQTQHSENTRYVPFFSL